MKKFLLLLTLISFGFINYSNGQRTDFGVYQIITPVTGTSITGGVPVSYSLRLKNNTTTTFQAGNVDTGVLYFRLGTYTPQAIGYYYAPAAIAPGDSTTLTFNLTLPNSIPEGTISVGFGMYWSKNPNPTTVYFSFNNYNFVRNAGLNDDLKSIDKLWFANGNLNLELSGMTNDQAFISITNLSGQAVKSATLYINGTGNIHQTIEAGDLVPGIYILNLRTEDGALLSKKFFVK